MKLKSCCAGMIFYSFFLIIYFIFRFKLYFNIKYNDESNNNNNNSRELSPASSSTSSANSYILKNPIFDIMGEETYENGNLSITNEAELWIASKPERYSDIFQKWKVQVHHPLFYLIFKYLGAFQTIP